MPDQLLPPIRPVPRGPVPFLLSALICLPLGSSTSPAFAAVLDPVTTVCTTASFTATVSSAPTAALTSASTHPTVRLTPAPETTPDDQAGGLSLERLNEITRPLLHEPGRTIVRLTLQDCIHRALAHNLDVRAGSYGPAVRMAEVVRAEAAFDAVLFGSAEFDITDRANTDATFFDRTVVTPTGAQVVRVPELPFVNTHDFNYALGLRKRLPTGATIELSQLLRRYHELNDDNNQLFLNPFHEFALQLTVKQPLLRDFGLDVNRASINAARNKYRISRQQFHLLVIDTVTKVETNYWRLVLTRQQLSVFRGLLYEAETTLRKLLARTSLDTNTELLSQTRALTERARAGIVTARNSILEQQNRLLANLNDPNLALGGAWEIIPLDPPTTEPLHLNDADALQTALQLRPEIIAQRLRVDTAGIAVGVAKNQRLPRLDLSARQLTSGAGPTEHNAWDQQWQDKAISYSVGLSFEVPLGNRAAEAFFTRTRAEQRQEIARLQSTREQVLADVRISLDALRHTHDEIISRTGAARAESQTLQSYNAMSDAEAGTTPDFLDRKLNSQERLANALLTLAHVIQQYNLTLMDVQRAQGTLLQYNNIRITEAPRR